MRVPLDVGCGSAGHVGSLCDFDLLAAVASHRAAEEDHLLSRQDDHQEMPAEA